MADWVAILEALPQGDPDAFDRVTRLITRYLAAIDAYQYRDSWDDLVQEVLIGLVHNPPARGEAGELVRYVQKATYRRYIDAIRKERGRRRASSGDSKNEDRGWRRNVELDEAAGVEGSGEAEETRLDPGIRKALDSIEPRKRDVVACRYLLGCTNEEGSVRLDIPLGTYKRLLSQGLAELRKLLTSGVAEC